MTGSHVAQADLELCVAEGDLKFWSFLPYLPSSRLLMDTSTPACMVLGMKLEASSELGKHSIN